MLGVNGVYKVSGGLPFPSGEGRGKPAGGEVHYFYVLADSCCKSLRK